MSTHHPSILHGVLTLYVGIFGKHDKFLGVWSLDLKLCGVARNFTPISKPNEWTKFHPFWTYCKDMIINIIV